MGVKLKKRCPYCGERVKKREYEDHISKMHGLEGEGEGVKEEFECLLDCVRCCEDPGAPLELTIGDMIRISGHLGVSAENLFQRYCFVMWNMIPNTRTLIPSIGLRFPCGFLSDGRCVIYEIRPLHCRLFPEALFVNLVPERLEAFTGTGYKCIDRGFEMGEGRKEFMKRLSEIDEEEMSSTAKYFDNFRYCVELTPEEYNMVKSLIVGVDKMERNERRRELCTEMIDRELREKARVKFLDKIKKLDEERDLERYDRLGKFLDLR